MDFADHHEYCEEVVRTQNLQRPVVEEARHNGPGDLILVHRPHLLLFVAWAEEVEEE